MDRRHPSRITDAFALALAGLLGLAWSVRDRAALGALRLPDTDDVMRLQQIRDWLGGQAWGDLTQYRLGAGVPMHWSRLADLGPALLIETAAPLLGRHNAEVAAVTLWPILLFAVALALVGRIAGTLDRNASRTAIVVAAIAYPATTLFAPGRIDHHGLQLVLLLGATLAAMGMPSARNGAIVGVLAATSLVMGVETMPFFAVLGAAAMVGWARAPAEGRGRVLGLGIGTLAGLAIAVPGFAGWQWRYPACDGFTAQATTGLAILALAPLALAGLGARRETSVRARLAIVVLVSLAALALAGAQAPSCLSPYGQVPAVLRRLWLDQVGEAQSVLAAPFGTVVGYAGVMVVGVAASLLMVRREPDPDRVLLLALQATAVAITAVQLRGAYTGAMLGAPALALLIDVARRRGAPSLAAAWAVSAGMLYPLIADALPFAPAKPAATSAAVCASPAMIASLARRTPGMVMAPIDVAPWGIAATPHRFVAGPYHRNTAGNLAMYRFFYGGADQARAIARTWNVQYVLYCDGALGTRQPGADSMARRLTAGRRPKWLTPLDSPRGPLFEVVR